MSLAGCFSGLPINPFLVLNLLLYIFDSIRGLYIQGYGFSSQGFDKNLHFYLYWMRQRFNSILTQYSQKSHK